MMTLINFTKHSTYVYDKRCRLGSCWLGGKIMEFWVEKQGCLPPMLPPNFFTILYVVESFTKFTYYVKNRDVCRRSSLLTPTQPLHNFVCCWNFSQEFTCLKNRDVCPRSSPHQTLLLTVWSSHQLISAHFFDLGKQIRVLGQQQEAFGIKRELEDAMPSSQICFLSSYFGLISNIFMV